MIPNLDRNACCSFRCGRATTDSDRMPSSGSSLAVWVQLRGGTFLRCTGIGCFARGACQLLSCSGSACGTGGSTPSVSSQGGVSRSHDGSNKEDGTELKTDDPEHDSGPTWRTGRATELELLSTAARFSLVSLWLDDPVAGGVGAVVWPSATESTGLVLCLSTLPGYLFLDRIRPRYSFTPWSEISLYSSLSQGRAAQSIAFA